MENKNVDSQSKSLVDLNMKLEEVKLLPCPMCGGVPIDSWAFAQWTITCQECGIQVHRGGDWKNFMPVVEAWNRRVQTEGNASPTQEGKQ